MNGPGPGRRFAKGLLDPQVVLLWVMGLIVLGIIFFFGQPLGPFFIAIIIAYMLEGLVRRLIRLRVPRWVAVTIVFCLFLAGVFYFFVWFIPMIVEQVSAFVSALPAIAKSLQKAIADLQTGYIAKLDSSYVQDIIPKMTVELEKFVQKIITQTITWLPGSVIGLVVYLFLVPILIIFFLMDKERILGWLSQFIPADRQLLAHILADVDKQMVNFFRGMFWRMLIIGGASVSVFLILGFRFAVLMGILSGLSTIIPYVGAIVVAIPVALLAYFQWGLAAGFFMTFFAYIIIQIIDGNILAPVLVGGMIRVRPAAIIFAILICGHLWGVWGVIFAFPIAIVVKSVLDGVLPYIRERALAKPPAEE